MSCFYYLEALRFLSSQTVNYSGPDVGGVPILELEADASSWEVGDQIVVAATHFDSRESEVFTIVECQGKTRSYLN